MLRISRDKGKLYRYDSSLMWEVSFYYSHHIIGLLYMFLSLYKKLIEQNSAPGRDE